MTMIAMNTCTVDTTDARKTRRVSRWTGISASLGRSVSLFRSRLYSGSKNRWFCSRNNIVELLNQAHSVSRIPDPIFPSRWFA